MINTFLQWLIGHQSLSEEVLGNQTVVYVQLILRACSVLWVLPWPFTPGQVVAVEGRSECNTELHRLIVP